ncbi:hypothetical protein JGUZn3_09700 [Entomobacter blattae]|uniref:Uncharacterized protein n=1 Tax=Entomobacter blattae TaxID=2762277 RepID=A0A7H1NQZ1_9PROT|nr:hypothetical protein JGUZn3_09700 [Entomobacter blattae]
MLNIRYLPQNKTIMVCLHLIDISQFDMGSPRQVEAGLGSLWEANQSEKVGPEPGFLL